MTEKSMSNSQILAIMRTMSDGTGKALLDKHLPTKLLYALRRSIPELEKAYKAYDASLTDICSKYGVKPSNPHCEDEEQQKQLTDELAELLNTETTVRVHTVEPDVLDKCGEGIYDPLSFAELDRLWWLINTNEEE